MRFQDENWFLARRTASTTNWHPAIDNALGTESYGTNDNDPLGSETFSVEYSTLPWTRILFAWGNLE